MNEDQGEIWTETTTVRGQPNAITWRVPIREARRQAESARRLMEARFRRAPFPLYGLAPSWNGRRFLGRAGWDGREGQETIRSLSLVHGTLIEDGSPMLHVESSSPDWPSGGDLLRTVAEELWRGIATTLPQAIDNVRSRMRRADHMGELSRLSRSDVPISFEGKLSQLDLVLSENAHWLGRIRGKGPIVTLGGHNFDVSALEIVRVVDLDPYIQGSRRFYEANDGLAE